MNIRHKLNATTRLVLTAGAMLAAMLPSAQAATKPAPLKVGQTVSFTLDKGGRQDYSLPLSKGSYRIVWDACRVDGSSSNIIAKMQLLKPNGAVINSGLVNFNSVGVTGRTGVVYNSAKPFLARLRIEADFSPLEMWLTVVPVSRTTRVPFGWGAKITPARISSENGVGGPIEANQSIYHSITLPKGKWSISLGFNLPEGQNTNLIGSVDMLDAQGFTTKQGLINLNEVNNQARQEAIVTILKPTPVLLRVTNGMSNLAYTYDLTIEKAG